MTTLSTKTFDTGEMTPKSRKVDIVKTTPNNVIQVKSTPLGKSANNLPAAPATDEKRGKRKKKNRGPRNKNKRAGEAKVEELETGLVVAPAIKESKKKSTQEKETKELSRGDKVTEKDIAVVPWQNWKLSPSLGGRFLQLDPVFAKNEKYIILAHAISLRIYSTKTSLLVRTISLPPTKPLEKIASYYIDPENDNNTYIATSLGRLFLWDWVDGKPVCEWNLGLPSLQFVSVCADERPESEKFVGTVYAAECAQKSGTLWRIQLPKDPRTVVEKICVFETTVDRIYSAQVLDGGKIIVVTAGRTLVVGNKQEGKSKWGVFRKYPMTFHLTCMDAFLPAIGASERKRMKGKKAKSGGGSGDLLGDVVIGDETGATYVFYNILRQKDGSKRKPVIRALHWHRKKVQSAKWSLDGNYIISGGSETVLVLWQIETGHKQYLPHLGSTISSIVISPCATSYAILLSDNSTMILSTTELKPKTNIAGIQAHVTDSRQSKVPCVLHPTTANRLLLAAPSSQADRDATSPYLQTFDTYSDRHVARQALTRTNATTFNSGAEHELIQEPNVGFIAITADGEWLATVDEWKPPKRKTVVGGADVEAGSPYAEEEGHGREVYLRFWKWSEKKKIWELVTRVDSPHPSANGLRAEEVLDLVPSPKGHGFATIGADGSVRIWRAKIRTRAGGAQVHGAEGGLISWGCRRVIVFSKGKREIELSTLALLDVIPENSPKSAYWGHVAFSEDGSVIAIAAPVQRMGTKENSTIHLADSDTGIVRQSIDLQVGRTLGLGILERYLIVLGTSKLLVWNLVNSNVQCEFSLDTLGASSYVSGGHLAIDTHSQTFAVAFPPVRLTDLQRVLIFDTTNAAPIHVQDIGLAPITALKSSDGKGYMVLDAEAKVQYISPTLAPHVSVAHQTSGGQFSLQDDDETLGGIGSGLSSVYLTNLAISSGNEGESITMDQYEGEDDDGVVDRVVSREAMESIFDAIPSYTAGSVEEAFGKVLALFTKKPLSVDDDDMRGNDDDEDKNEDGGEVEYKYEYKYEDEGEYEDGDEDMDMEMVTL